MHTEAADPAGGQSLNERLVGWIHHLEHVLPAQAPIRDFVHHNTLHGFQHLPFAEALASAQALLGARAWWPETRFREAYASGRITDDDLAGALASCGLEGLAQPVVAGRDRQAVLQASLLVDPEPPTAARLDWLRREAGLGDDLAFAICRALTAGDSRLPGGWLMEASERWSALAARVGREWTLRGLLAYLTGEDVLERVRSVLRRHLAAHLDLGVAPWVNPCREQGFFAAWKASAALDIGWEMDELPNVRDEIAMLGNDPLAVLAEELSRVVPDERLWPGYLQRLALETPGWSGMCLWREQHPGRGDGTPVALADLLAVRILLERLLSEDLVRRLTGLPMGFDEFVAYYHANLEEFFVRDAWRTRCLPEDLHSRVAARICHDESATPPEEWAELAGLIADCSVLDEAAAWRLYGLLARLGLSEAERAGLTPDEAHRVLATADLLPPARRAQIWLIAYEAHYRDEVLSALAANRDRRQAVTPPTAQAVFCMDDREEGTRRHLEELAPAIETFGAAGFFGVPMLWQGKDDVQPAALCPVTVVPAHRVDEVAAGGEEAALARRRARRNRRLHWQERLLQATRSEALMGPLLTALAGVPALLGLGATLVAPRATAAAVGRWQVGFDGEVPTRVALNSDDPDCAHPGFDDAEQVRRVAGFLSSLGLTAGFAPLVVLMGHGSGSRNNPHLSAYDCGACSGRHGGPNARVFAAMANRPQVRAGLQAMGISIPESTWFLGAEHNTCDEAVTWYDTDLVPASLQVAFDRLVAQMAEACRAHAVERCRRLASAPAQPLPWPALHHLQGRAADISQARPELGHANNAAAFIGRRAISRGLFLDRRVYLISYDPIADDAEGRIAEQILLAAGPVGAGISLEYYFSSVDNEVFGCGSKITHNVTGLFGVMDGADSDLRTGLPWQMVEIHEPMRLLVVVEQETAVLSAILARQPALHGLVEHGWLNFAAISPSSGAIDCYRPGHGWVAWQGERPLPQVARSIDWFAGKDGPLGPAVLTGAAV